MIRPKYKKNSRKSVRRSRRRSIRRSRRRSVKRSHRRSRRSGRLMSIQTSTFDTYDAITSDAYVIFLDNATTDTTQCIGVFTTIKKAKLGLIDLITKNDFLEEKDDPIFLTLYKTEFNKVLYDGHTNNMSRIFSFSTTKDRLNRSDNLKSVILGAIDGIPYENYGDQKDAEKRIREEDNKLRTNNIRVSGL